MKSHEPLLETIRFDRLLHKKIKAALAKQNYTLAERLQLQKDSINNNNSNNNNIASNNSGLLAHLVKERYPSFIDALRDLDDPLTLTALFANLPSINNNNNNNKITFNNNYINNNHSNNEIDYNGIQIKANQTHFSSLLLSYWESFIIQTKSLRKVYCSIKGFYFAAEVQNCEIVWIKPHAFVQKLPQDVDYKVMSTFLEFYHCLLEFVLFRLFHSIGRKYPPTINKENKNKKSDTMKKTLEEKLEEEEEEDNNNSNNRLSEIYNNDIIKSNDTDDNKISTTTTTTTTNISGDNSNTGNDLFRGAVFFISREVPREVLLLCCASFGAEIVGWEEYNSNNNNNNNNNRSPINEDDRRITHQIVDRPLKQSR